MASTSANPNPGRDPNPGDSNPQQGGSNPRQSFFDPKKKTVYEIPEYNDVLKEYRKGGEWRSTITLSEHRLCEVEGYNEHTRRLFRDSCKEAEIQRGMNRPIPKLYPSDPQWVHDVYGLEEHMDNALVLDVIRGCKGIEVVTKYF